MPLTLADSAEHAPDPLRWLLLAATAVAFAVVYLISLRLFPFTACRSCTGSGKTRDRIFRGAFGACRRCAGTGRKPRLGVRLLNGKGGS